MLTPFERGEDFATECHICELCGESRIGLERMSDGLRVCRNCAEHAYVTCERCGSKVHVDDSKTVGDEQWCSKCACLHALECSHCGGLYHESELSSTHDGEYACEKCADEYYFTCEVCGKLAYLEEVTSVGDEHWCPNCVDTYAERCACCGDYFDRNTTYPTEDGDVCERCYDREYSTCDMCGAVVNIERGCSGEYGFYCSEDCREESEPNACAGDLHDSGYQPTPEFRKENSEPIVAPYFGIELEFNFDSSSARAQAVDRATYAFNDFFYCKEDCSLNMYGVEFVSHPATLDWWHNNKEDLDDLLTDLDECDAHASTSTGLHIHISRKDITKEHEDRFDDFFKFHSARLTTLGKRNSAAWARFPDATFGKDRRYRAVNWTNSNTVELRFFMASLDLNYVMGAIEFAHAVYHFSKDRDLMESWTAFIVYIMARREQYSYLVPVLHSLDLMSPGGA